MSNSTGVRKLESKMKSMSLALPLTMFACGGAPFEMMPATDDASPGEDASANVRAAEHPDAAVAPDASPDAATPEDAAHDTSQSTDSCVQVQPFVFACGPTVNVTAPDWYCHNGAAGYGGTLTPAACLACGLYTCACIEPRHDCGGQSKTCDDSGGKITVTCQ